MFIYMFPSNILNCADNFKTKITNFQSDVFRSTEGRAAQRPLAVSLLGGGGDHTHGPARQDIGR